MECLDRRRGTSTAWSFASCLPGFDFAHCSMSLKPAWAIVQTSMGHCSNQHGPNQKLQGIIMSSWENRQSVCLNLADVETWSQSHLLYIRWLRVATSVSSSAQQQHRLHSALSLLVWHLLCDLRTWLGVRNQHLLVWNGSEEWQIWICSKTPDKESLAHKRPAPLSI